MKGSSHSTFLTQTLLPSDRIQNAVHTNPLNQSKIVLTHHKYGYLMSSPPDARLPTAAGLVLYLVQSISINSTVLPPPVGPCALASFQETLLLSPPWLKYLEICGLQDQSGFQGTQNPLHPGPGPTSNFISLPCPRLSPKPSGSLPCAFPASLQASGPAVVPSLLLGNAPHPGRKPNCPSTTAPPAHLPAGVIVISCPKLVLPRHPCS